MKTVCLILVLGLLLLPLPARAWRMAEDSVFGLREDLPASVQEALPEELPLRYAYGVGDYLYAWTEDADGNTVVFAFLYQSEAYSLVLRTAPVGAWNGLAPSFGYSGKGFFSIDFSEDYRFQFAPRKDGRWVLSFCHDFSGPQDRFITLCPHAAMEDVYEPNGRRMIFGNWTQSLYADTMDMSALPRDFGDVCAMLDTDGWAMVKSAEPETLAPLRMEPSADGDALGLYYTGAPVTVLDAQGEWYRVSVAGEEGWMAAENLAFGESMTEITTAFPDLSFTSEAYEEQSILHTSLLSSTMPLSIAVLDGEENPDAVEGLFIIGVVGDRWYHVMNWQGESGFIECSWFYEGNG